MVTINHPFHPLHGQSFALLSFKEVNGLFWYSLKTDTGVICVPENWATRQPEAAVSPPSLSFDLLTLKELVHLLRTLEDSPE